MGPGVLVGESVGWTNDGCFDGGGGSNVGCVGVGIINVVGDIGVGCVGVRKIGDVNIGDMGGISKPRV